MYVCMYHNNDHNNNNDHNHNDHNHNDNHNNNNNYIIDLIKISNLGVGKAVRTHMYDYF
jgi:hypothetical protein